MKKWAPVAMTEPLFLQVVCVMAPLYAAT